MTIPKHSPDMNPIRSHTTLEGKLDHITYYNEDNHYTIARLKTKGVQTYITIVGYLAGVAVGQQLEITGVWDTHPKYGQQFKVTSYSVVLPATVDGIRGYLRSGVIKGIGKKMANRLVKHFGDQTLNIIETHTEKLTEVEGIGPAKAKRIAQGWQEQHAVRRLMQFLHDNGVKSSFSGKILKLYGENAVDILRTDPFRIANDLPGIGFQIADAIALNMGLSEDDPQRIRACIINITEQNTSQGHTFIYQERILERCFDIFRIEPEKTLEKLAVLAEDRQLVIEPAFEDQDEPAIYPIRLHQAETAIANKLKAMQSVPIKDAYPDSERITSEVLKKLAIQLSTEQLNVLQEILTHRVAIITGGPGTGKTTLIRSVNAIFELMGKTVILAAPTGRAARRLTEIAHCPAATLHKLLGFNLEEGVFERTRDNPLDGDAIIVDEASMVDVVLMDHLLQAVRMTSTLILVGDIFQLPSVGPGNVLADIIRSQSVRTFELTRIFRQAQESMTVMNAHKVRQGQWPDIALPSSNDSSEKRLSDFYFIEKHTPAQVVEAIVLLCSQKIPDAFNLNRTKDIQVITPMHKGEVGAINLNRVLQKALNPHHSGKPNARMPFKHRDKVMHLKNNYKKDIFNGDIGVVLAKNPNDKELTVNFDGRIISYEPEELEDLTLAYAITVHKSQGSEYPAVIMPLMTQHYALLQRNLLYTAMTRGRQLVILIGAKRALGIALNNDKPQKRFSSLALRLA
ncbi:ATP-dependent RecD-like DNA helicase [Desulfococcaceae bacterium HSG9]|nr:ATP-dependent RecD-like DNA helicase [Desulfococcaceae bacterium HSG9]